MPPCPAARTDFSHNQNQEPQKRKKKNKMKKLTKRFFQRETENRIALPAEGEQILLWNRHVVESTSPWNYRLRAEIEPLSWYIRIVSYTREQSTRISESSRPRASRYLPGTRVLKCVGSAFFEHQVESFNLITNNKLIYFKILKFLNKKSPIIDGIQVHHLKMLNKTFF